MAKRGMVTCAVLGMASSAFAGARIDLRPTPNLPVYAPNQAVLVEVFVVDTGTPGVGDIAARGVQFDFADNTGTLNAQVDIPFFDWDYNNNIGLGAEFFTYPTTSWIWPIATPNMFQFIVPADGEAKVGKFNVNVGAAGGTLNALNPDEANPNFGAFLTYGFGGPGDPVVLWRANTGDLTGGTLALPVPEPASLALLGLGALAAFRRRRSA